MWGSTPRLTDWLTVNRNVTLTLTFEQESVMSQSVKRRAGGWCEMAANLEQELNCGIFAGQ
jgi:ABC-type nitrate/sulfonate/bicarbonate transport system ATPase subunit